MARETKKSASTQDLRTKILDTALELFTTRGYFNTSVHDIRREADISIGSIYHHFKSKEEVAKAIYNDLLESETATISGILEGYGTAHDRCRAIMAHLFAMTEERPRAVEFMVHAKHREFMPSALPICSSVPYMMMRQAVAEGIEAGEIRPMAPVVAATCLFGSMFRLVQMRLEGLIEEPLPGYMEEVWECAWRGVACD